MTYFLDLGTESGIVCGPRVRAIGWLSSSHPYPRGEASPTAFVAKLREVCAAWGGGLVDLGWPAAGGSHTCDFCGSFWASGNIGIPSLDVLYAAPEMVAHYVEAHGYLPPEEFVATVLACPMLGSPEYAMAVSRVFSG